MFAREKYSKSNQFFNSQCASKNITTSNKYHQRPFHKNQKQLSKKYKCDRPWRKNSSFYWSEKENDKNTSNYPHNKKFYFEGKKSFHYHKKNTKTKFDYNFNYNEEESKNQINENEFKNNDEYEYATHKESLKDERSNSIDYTATTAYSHSKSSSAQEELNSNNNNNINNNSYINVIENLNLNNFKSQELALKKYSSAEIRTNNQPFNSEFAQDISNQFFSNLMKINMNFIRFNSNKEITEYIPSRFQKGQNNKRKYSDTNSNNFEPYNKYNTVNQELNQLISNPMTENTEILNVSVKISQNKKVVFKLRRFDDLFLTVKLFCEINQIEEKLMKPIIIKILCSLNSIYQIYNYQLDVQNMQRLRRINSFINNTFI